jgi:hypothetical protein
MRRLSQAELLTATAFEKNLLKQRHHRSQVALAFGRDRCYEPLSYIELDAAAILLTDTLAKVYELDVAAQIVRVHCDKWAEAVALCEIDYKTPGYFFVADFKDSRGKAAHLTGASNVDQGVESFAYIPQAAGHELVSINTVNMAPLIRFVQKTGAAHGINLLDRWVPPHGSPEFKTMFWPYADARDAAIKKVGTDAMLLKAGGKVRASVEKMIEVSDGS